MKVKFDCFAGDELVNAYLDFIRKSKSKEVYVKYFSDKFGFKEMMEGKLQINDLRLRDLPKHIKLVDTKHNLELTQKDWKIKFGLKLYWESSGEGSATLSFNDSLKNEVYNQFKKFQPIKTK